MIEKEHKDFVGGSEVDKVTMIETIKGIMIDLFRGYPAYEYCGIIEGRFGDFALGSNIRDKLKDDGLIKVQEKGGKIYYRLTSDGAKFANSLDLKKKAKDYTLIAFIVACISMIIGLIEVIPNIVQSLKIFF